MELNAKCLGASATILGLIADRLHRSRVRSPVRRRGRSVTLPFPL